MNSGPKIMPYQPPPHIICGPYKYPSGCAGVCAQLKAGAKTTAAPRRGGDTTGPECNARAVALHIFSSLSVRLWILSIYVPSATANAAYPA
jgi:hypothetical protein